MTEVRIVWLVFHRHKENHDPVDQLHAFQRGDTHVEENSIQDGHRDELQIYRSIKTVIYAHAHKRSKK